MHANSQSFGQGIGIGIIGGTGFGAGELLRLLTFRDDCEVISVVSSSKSGSNISEVHPQLMGAYSGTLELELDLSAFENFEHRVLFMALPHGVASSRISELLAEAEKHKVKIVDLSGDFRLQENAQADKHYPEAKPFRDAKSKFVYGVPELYRAAISKSDYVANSGCFAISGILAAAPLALNLKVNRVVIDGKSGTSGAGKTLSDAFHHPTAQANAFAYNVLTHRHEAEIAQGLGNAKLDKFEISFVPHVIPCSRGIYATAHVFLDDELSAEDATKLYQDFYADSPFVRVRESAPHLNAVVGSNYCDISVFTRGKSVVATAALDNLIKGMCGTALQNMNLMCGLAETEGLLHPGLGPI